MVILKHEDKYLLLKRAKAPNKGKYLPVGGKLDPFESPRECAIRETFEETGIRIDSPKFCGTLVESSPSDYNWLCYIYLAEIDDMDPPACDEGELKWISEKDLDKIPTPATDLLIYKYIKNGLQFAFSAQYDKNLNLIEMWEEVKDEKII